MIIFIFCFLFSCCTSVIGCPIFNCAPRFHCEREFVTDTENCLQCDCVPANNQCGAEICPPGSHCVQTIRGCEIPYPDQPCDPWVDYQCVLGCPQHKCDPCASGYMNNTDGCATCTCNDQCESISCPTGKKCVKNADTCGRACDAMDTYTCEECPVHDCLPDVSCPDGFAKDENGCLTCDCLQPYGAIKCGDKFCPRGAKCERRVTGCEHPPPMQPCDPILVYECVFPKTTPIIRYPQPKCPDMAGVKCRGCESGPYTDENGCSTCDCNDPCERAVCPADQFCSETGEDTIRYKCVQNPECLDMSAVKCAPCKSGFYTDQNGCFTCECNDPCENVECAPDQSCVASPSTPTRYKCVDNTCTCPKKYSIMPRPTICRDTCNYCFKGFACCQDVYGCKSCQRCPV